MTTATTERNLMGLGLPAPLARLMVEGPMEFNGTTNIGGANATTSTSAGTSITIAGGNGGSTSGNGGSIIMQPGSVTSGTAGMIVARGVQAEYQAAPAAKTTTTTLTAAELLGVLITANSAAAANQNYTLPTGTNLEAAFPFTMAVNDAFDFYLINTSTVAAETITILTNTGWTLVGNMVVVSNSASTASSSARFLARRTAANTFTLYRIG